MIKLELKYVVHIVIIMFVMMLLQDTKGPKYCQEFQNIFKN
jgi:hypothetical protein